MSTLPADVDPQAPASTSLSARVAALHASTRQRLLTNAGFYEADTLNQQPIKDTDWGFASRLPDLGQLLEQASQHAIDPSSSNPLPGAGYLAALHESRTFSCPDCVDAMAEAYGVSAAVHQLRGSVIRCQLDEESQRATEDARQLLKSQLRLGWSSEAVKQGVAHAKKGEYDAALGCYKKALDLDRRNVDAWVARGAAYANQHAFPKAVADFQTALEIEPGHVNASKYLRVTEQHMTQLGLPVPHVPHPQQPLAATNPWAVQQHQAAEHSVPVQPAVEPSQRTKTGHVVQAAAMPQSADTQAADRRGSNEQSSSSGDEASQKDMDLQKALKIISKHYVSRNTTRITCFQCFEMSLVPLTALIQQFGTALFQDNACKLCCRYYRYDLPS